MNYNQFLQQKRHSIGDFGFKSNYIPDMAFDFQSYIIEKAIKKAGDISPKYLDLIKDLN